MGAAHRGPDGRDAVLLCADDQRQGGGRGGGVTTSPTGGAGIGCLPLRWRRCVLFYLSPPGGHPA
jgi:hypothetical protein